MRTTRNILGLDPGLRFTGWGLIQQTPAGLIYRDHGILKIPATGVITKRLATLFREVLQILRKVRPDAVAVEEVFVNTNGTSTMKLCMARGVVLLAPEILNIPVVEYGANAVKKTVTGNGHASKEQVAYMVERLLQQCPQMTDGSHADGTDALAIAICHAHAQILHYEAS